ncbi:MAG TPA: prenyltransferase/squalene oxidase repeat-containing protein [Tepidisphaeraceae bacterium]|jgi:squalene-hopene/tetraprenyl-beta-curcumene cyclase
MKCTRRQFITTAAVAAAVASFSPILPLASAESPVPNASVKADPAGAAQAEIDRGLAYLKTQQQPDGGWQLGQDPPAITAITLKAFVQDPHFNANDPFLQKAYDKLLSYQQADGSISDDKLATYNTAIALSALGESKQPKYQKAMEKALGYLREIQWTDKVQGVPENMKVPESNPNYGGFGYGKKGARADMSNLQIALDALHDSGLKPDDPAYQAALKFVTRAQNNSETNDQKWAGDDGGFIYSGADGGSSKAGEYTAPDGRKMFRSYGSITYAGLKSMIYAGLSHDDPRVKAAWKWVTNNWTLDENPGIRYGDPTNPKGGDDGLFYYYHTLARALHAYGQPVITDARGAKHDWRAELVEKLATQQQGDGHWTGIQKWMENKPILSTAYAILALQEAQQDLKEHPAGR